MDVKTQTAFKNFVLYQEAYPYNDILIKQNFEKDELKFFINGKEVKPFASQGQQRSVVLALKLAELETIKEEKESPVLLLDDVFSELDNSRQELFLNYLENEQVFITSTSAKTKNLKNFLKIRVSEGKTKTYKK